MPSRNLVSVTSFKKIIGMVQDARPVRQLWAFRTPGLAFRESSLARKPAVPPQARSRGISTREARRRAVSRVSPSFPTDLDDKSDGAVSAAPNR